MESSYQEPQSRLGEEKMIPPAIHVSEYESSTKAGEDIKPLSRQRGSIKLPTCSQCQSELINHDVILDAIERKGIAMRDATSCVSVDSGFSDSRQTSQQCLPADTPTQRPQYLEIHRDRSYSSASASSENSDGFVTAPSSIKSDSSESEIDRGPSSPADKWLEIKKQSSMEVDGPYSPRRGSLEKSCSLDMDTSEPKPRVRKRSKTEPHAAEIKSLLTSLTTREAIEQLGEDGEKVLKEAIKKNAVVFRDCTDFKMLHAHLFQEELVHSDENEKLYSETRTNIDKANYFYLIVLPRKGPTAYRRCYLALKGEQKHLGHEHLTKLLESEMEAKKVGRWVEHNNTY